MYSGKSTEITRIANKYKILRKNLLLINHSLDNRYSDNNISTHNKIMLKCTSVDNLTCLKSTESYLKSEIVIIEEAQFFKDLFQFVIDGAEVHNKTMIVVGLNGDSDRNPFGDILKLIPYCDSVKKLDAFCIKCGDGTLAHFSKKVNKNICSQIHVGTEESYIAVCRKHYLE
tara:strand:+ start:4419 stop:4934 length:516 start_codon:yes stop_codon:yes gene_type:complete